MIRVGEVWPFLMAAIICTLIIMLWVRVIRTLFDRANLRALDPKTAKQKRQIVIPVVVFFAIAVGLWLSIEPLLQIAGAETRGTGWGTFAFWARIVWGWGAAAVLFHFARIVIASPTVPAEPPPPAR